MHPKGGANGGSFLDDDGVGAHESAVSVIENCVRFCSYFSTALELAILSLV
jgi:hypothetical protein